MTEYKKGQTIFIRDYPFGKPLNVKGKIVGILNDDYYNVLIETGLLEGEIKRYKSWKLFSLDADNEI